MVVAAESAGGSLADRARLRPLRAGLRGRRTEIPDVRRPRRVRYPAVAGRGRRSRGGGGRVADADADLPADAQVAEPPCQVDRQYRDRHDR
ncbi:hypothetical protein SGPA1_40165 [Streptomyces misionensis JCM 4497]